MNEITTQTGIEAFKANQVIDQETSKKLLPAIENKKARLLFKKKKQVDYLYKLISDESYLESTKIYIN